MWTSMLLARLSARIMLVHLIVTSSFSPSSAPHNQCWELLKKLKWLK